MYIGREYRRTPLLNRLRNLHGLIIPMNIYDHRELHEDMGGVPKPKLDAVEHFLNGVVLPYEEGQPRSRTLDQAIGFFAMTGNEATAEHLMEQRAYILRTPILGEGQEVA